MFRSVHSSPDASNDHMRHLLDQRANRADPHDRFSALSQFSDTPSVYSRAYFSSKASDRGEAESFTSDYHYSPGDVRSNRERLDDPHISTLDLDDDPRSSTDTSETYDDDSRSFEEPSVEEPIARMSYLGPKMRFHSRAPWEMEADALQEEDEPLESPKHIGFPFGLGGGSKGGTSASSSPRPSQSIKSRPSGESFRSNAPPKRSFDTINSQMSSRGALYVLAQESMSTTSLSKTSNPKDGLLGKISSLGRTRVQSSNITMTPSPVASSPARSLFNPRMQSPGPLHKNGCNKPQAGLDQVDYGTVSSNRSGFTGDRVSFASTEEAVHPYAHPDLVVTYETETESPFPQNNIYHPPIRNDSNATVTQHVVPDGSSSSRSVLSVDSSSSSLATASTPRNRLSSIHGREISSPLAVHGSSLSSVASSNLAQGNPDALFTPGIGNLPGWTEKFVPPTFSLISLEEARAQRTHNSTSPPDLSRTVSTSTSIASQSTTTLNPDDSSNSISVSSLNSGGTRSRGRTISAGAKAKNALQSMVGTIDRRDSEPAIFQNVSQAGKPLKHKKSGFMRLFNGGKDKDGEAPPPLPSMASELNTAHKKSNVSRVPVPSFSSNVFESPSKQDPIANSASSSESVSSPKRSPPTLHINTLNNTHSTIADVSQRYQSRTVTSLSTFGPDKPWQKESQPQSAPPDVSGFPALKLRPVSGLFSSHFADHMVPDFQTNSGAHAEIDTPTTGSPNDLISPITPAGNERLSSAHDMEDQSATIKSLQQQLASSKATWQRNVWDLEAQIRDLKLELEGLRSKRQDDMYCSTCGRSDAVSSAPPGSGRIVNRPRAKTGTSSRFANALA